MSEVSRFIESGILEMYVLGDTTPEQSAEVERMAKIHLRVKEELTSIEILLEDYALSHAKQVDPTIKPFFLASINYLERLGNGEQRSLPPKLHKDSLSADYSQWLDRPELQLTEPVDEIEARIIGATREQTTAIVWIKNGSPPETHKDVYESFLILEGTCNIIVDGKNNYLKAGDVFTIPLHLSHTVIVTSDIPCKVILERLAA